LIDMSLKIGRDGGPKTSYGDIRGCEYHEHASEEEKKGCVVRVMESIR
jgi:hypothetical protein